jgi:integrase
MLDAYLKVFRPLLFDGPSSSLFVSSTGKAKRNTTYSTQFSQFIRRETDLELNPHLMRHFAANRVIDANPGDAEVARRLLGHRSIDTTRKFYVEPSNQRRAIKVYQDLNRRDRAETNAVPKLEFDFSRRKRRGSK